MNIKKFFLEFYLYYPVYIIILLFASCLFLLFCPSNIFLKLFVTFSFLLLVVGMVTYGVMQIRNRLWTFIFIVIMLIAFGFMGYNQTKNISEDTLFNNYRRELYSYVGAPYAKNYELKTKIDEYGLIFAPMRHAMVETGIISLDIPLILSGITCIYKDIRSDIENKGNEFFYEVPINKSYVFQNGDVFFSKDKVYIYMCKIVNGRKKECLITTGPNENVHLIGFKKDKKIYKSSEYADDIVKNIDNNCVYKWKLVNYR